MMFSLDALARQNGHHGLSSRERANLTRCLARASHRLLIEATELHDAAEDRPSALDAYVLPRDGYHAWYQASIETAQLAVAWWCPMGDDGTGVAPDTDRCPSCGHLLDRECGCGCCVVAYCDCLCWPDRQAP